MKLILTDVESDYLTIDGSYQMIENNGNIHHCIGCFNCWVRTPGKCIISDGYEEMGRYLSTCAELIIISECFYGSTSPFIKNVMDRAISYIHPAFCIRNGEMHHKRRYDNKIKLTAYFYGEAVTATERETACKLIKANAVNYDGEADQIIFLKNKEELRGIRL